MIKNMITRKIILTLLVLSVVGIGVGYILDNLFHISNCYTDGVYKDNVLCEDFFDHMGEALIPSMSALAIVFLAFLFVPQTFPVWKRFAIWAIPVAAFLMSIAPQSNSGGLGGGIGFGPTAEDAYIWVPTIFVLTSLIIIIRAWWKSRKSH